MAVETLGKKMALIIQQENREIRQSEQPFIGLCHMAASELKWESEI
jgi:hypothetical protein